MVRQIGGRLSRLRLVVGQGERNGNDSNAIVYENIAINIYQPAQFAERGI